MLKILYQIARADTRFLIEPNTAARLAGLLQQVYAGKVAPDAAFGNPGLQMAREYSVKSGSGKPSAVAVIDIYGVMTMEDQPCAGPGTETIGRMIQHYDRSASVDAIVLNISSPGGEARYTETLAGIVASTSKPVVAYVNQLTASAAYWTASAADEIMLSGHTAEVGSIGTVLEYIDPSRAMDKEGFDLVQITASKSTAKRKYNFSQPSEEDKDLIRTEWLDPINEVFLSHVQANRPGIAEAALTAEMYIGQKAIDAGLADSFGSLEDAIIRAANLSQNHNSQMNTQQKQSAFQKGVAALKASLGLDAPQVEQIEDAPAPEAVAPAATEEVATLQAQIAQLTTERDQLQQDLEATRAELITATNTLTEQQATLDQLTQEVAALGNAPAKDPIELVAATDGGDTPVQGKGKYDPNKSPITREAMAKFPIPEKA